MTTVPAQPDPPATHRRPSSCSRRVRRTHHRATDDGACPAAGSSGTSWPGRPSPSRPSSPRGPARAAAVPSGPQVPEVFDLGDLQTRSALATSQLITITLDKEGVAHFAIPRMEVGQGITTAAAMLIAEELDLPLDKVEVTLAPARPELVFDQLTGGSNTMESMYTPIRVAAAVAKGRLLAAAATLPRCPGVS